MNDLQKLQQYLQLVSQLLKFDSDLKVTYPAFFTTDFSLLSFEFYDFIFPLLYSII